MARWMIWHCPLDTGFEIQALVVTVLLSFKETSHNIKSLRVSEELNEKKWTNKWKNERANEWPNEQIYDFRLHLFIYRLNWVRRIWGWRDEWYDTVLWTQDSKFKPWWSQYYPRSRRLPTILNLYEWAKKKLLFLRNLNVRARDETRDLRFFKQAALATAPGHTRNYFTSSRKCKVEFEWQNLKSEVCNSNTTGLSHIIKLKTRDWKGKYVFKPLYI